MSIQEHLDKIRNAVYGREVRESIAKGIETAYDDASEKDNANMEVKIARGTHPNLRSRLEEVDDKQQQTTAQLAQTATKEELNDIGVSQINKNKGLLDETYLSDTLKSQIIGQTELGQTVPDNSVTLIKTAFSEITSANLFNKDEAVSGALGSTGNIVENSNFYTSDFIRVTESDIVNTTHSMQNYAFYDADKNYLSGLSNAGVTTVTVPSGAYYIRVSFYFTNLNTFMLSIGELPYAYEPFKRAIHGRHLDRIDGASIDKGTLPIQAIENLTTGKNMLDVAESVDGQYLNNGVLSPNASLSTSNYIDVTPSTDYVPTSQRVVEFYDSGKNLLEAISETSYPVNKTVTSPENARLMRISYRTSDKHFMQVEQGSVATPFEPFGYKIPTLLINGQNVINTTDNTQTSEGIINIASPLYATVGEELNIYHDNILKEYTDNYNLRYTCELGGQFDKGYKLTPQTTGTYPLTVLLYEGSRLINSKIVDVIVVNPRTTKKDVLVIGDSLVNQNHLTQRLIDKLGSNINLIGTRGTAPNKHEGRSGWTIARYRTNQSFEGAVNPFYNGDFDFNYYMTNNDIANVDVVMITLGTNDTFNFGSDEAILSGLNGITQDLDYIVNNIKSYNPNIKVAINLTIPPNANQQKFGEQKLAGTVDQTRWRYKYNNAIWVNELIKRYSNLDLVNTHVNINTQSEIADHIHPTVNGYEKKGDVIYSYLNSL